LTPAEAPPPASRAGATAHVPTATGITPSILWALFGVGLLFALAIVRLGARGLTTVRAGLEPGAWVALLALTVLFVYTEGIRALQRRWGPHMLRRVASLRVERRLWVRLLAPLFALSLIAAPGRELARAWAGAFAIMGAVLLVRALPEPWRGIIDLAVALALTWGSVAIARAAARMFGGRRRGF
jgi:hypothetical protein